VDGSGSGDRDENRDVDEDRNQAVGRSKDENGDEILV
jgi:hypothetical protein